MVSSSGAVEAGGGSSAAAGGLLVCFCFGGVTRFLTLEPGCDADEDEGSVDCLLDWALDWLGLI